MKYIKWFSLCFALAIFFWNMFCGTPKNRKYYIDKYEGNISDFLYFSNIRSRFFENSRAKSYGVIFTIRHMLYQLCVSNNTDINQQCNSDFLTEDEVLRAKVFMEKAHLHSIVYYKDSICFIFDGELRKIATYNLQPEGVDTIDSNFAFCIIR